MKLSVWGKGITGALEAVLAIPLIGGAIVMGSGYGALSLALWLHIAVLVICLIQKKSFKSSILGIVTSLFGWVFGLGWILHTLSAIALIYSAYKTKKSAIATP